MKVEDTRAIEERIRAVTNPVIFRRGLDYFLDGRVERMEVIGENSVKGIVDGGNGTYETQVHVRGDDVITDCTCPYDWTAVCKHAVALALAYDEESQLELFDSDMDNLPDAPDSPAWLTTMRMFEDEEGEPSFFTFTPLSYQLAVSPGDKPGIAVEVSRLIPQALPFTPEDTAILNLLRPAASHHAASSFTIDDDRVDPLLRLLVRRPRVFIDEGRTPARIALEPEPVETRLTKDGSDHLLSLTLGGDRWRGREGLRILGRRVPWVTDGVEFAPLKTALDGATLSALNDAPTRIPAEDFPYFTARFLDPLIAKTDPVIETDAVPEIRDDLAPTPTLTLGEAGGGMEVSLSFAYGDGPPQAAVGDEATLVKAAVADEAFLARRQQETEAAAVALLEEYCPALDLGETLLMGETAVEFLAFGLPKLRKAGFEIVGEIDNLRFNRRRPKPRASVDSGIDWFDLNVNIDYGDTSAGISEVLAAYRGGRRVVKLEDGSWGALPVAWLRKLGKPLEELEKRAATESGLRVRRYDAPLIDDILAGFERVESDDGWRRLSHDLRDFKGLEPASVSPGLMGELRDYQAHGVAWIDFLRRFGFGGVLADDMGLGKTIQAIALLLSEHRDKGVGVPSLIVTPTSVAFNWVSELARFAPDLKVLRLTGSQRAKLYDDIERSDIVITTYPLLRRDIGIFGAKRFHYAILDEAQFIKNAVTDTAKAARALNAANRLALTGTPIENHLGELWSIFEFLMPGFFGSYRDFNERYEKPLARKDKEALRLLIQKTRPFILRRTKDEVARELPPKTETITYCQMTPAQATLYRQLLNTYRVRIMETIDKQGIERSQISILDALMKLRQVCCHPRLLKIAGNKVKSSGKMDVFNELITELIEEGHRALVFSQFTQMLAILREWLEARGIKYEYLDGRTRNREKAVTAFNEGDAPLFLISLKAGGSGLNLTAADYVIHYDPWWNPAVEAQATDRAHRIGQDKHVFAYKLIAKDTIEEKVLELQKQKRALFDNVIGATAGQGRGLTRKDLKFLFSAE